MSSRRIRPLVLALIASVLLVPTVGAATVVSGDNYVLPAGKSIEGNLYAFGQSVRIEGAVKGDVVAAGVKVEIAKGGKVEGDVLAAGQGVLIDGVVEGDVRAAAFTVQVEEDGRVGGELVAAGFSVGVAEGAVVGGDVMAAASQGLIDGKVGGDVRFAGGGLSVEGQVEGDVYAEVDAAAEGGADKMPFIPMIQVQPPRMIGPGLDVGESARIGGTLSYTSPLAVEVPGKAVKGKTDFNKLAETEDKKAAAEEEKAASSSQTKAQKWFVDLVKNYIALVLFAVLFALVAPRALEAGADTIQRRLLPTFGWGVGTAAVAMLLIVLVPIVTVALLVLIGVLHIGPLAKPVMATALVVGTLVTAGTYLLSWFGRVMVSHAMGRRLLSPLHLGPRSARWLSLLLGLLIYAVLVSLPWIGFLIKLVLLFLGLGAVMAMLWQWWRSRGAGAEAVAEAGA
jgi:cytoskeletal protein CcmA (bactofilin family)